MIDSLTVLWSVGRANHEYRAELLGSDGHFDLRIVRDGDLLFAQPWLSEHEAIEESERYRAQLLDVVRRTITSDARAESVTVIR
jgi:hypothetical protein